eukprot:COSAG02_NODE_5412_length_4349_cov_8.741176_6_plen_36_part_01
MWLLPHYCLVIYSADSRRQRKRDGRLAADTGRLYFR